MGIVVELREVFSSVVTDLEDVSEEVLITKEAVQSVNADTGLVETMGDSESVLTEGIVKPAVFNGVEFPTYEVSVVLPYQSVLVDLNTYDTVTLRSVVWSIQLVSVKLISIEVFLARLNS